MPALPSHAQLALSIKSGVYFETKFLIWTFCFDKCLQQHKSVTSKLVLSTCIRQNMLCVLRLVP